MTMATSRIVWPPQALARSIFCMIVRDTRGVALDEAQRFNFFPASPFCSMAWIFAGDWHLIREPVEMKRPWTGAKLSALTFSGAQLAPPVSWNPGETFTIVIVFYPDAFAAISGLDLSRFTGRTTAADEVLPQRILEPCRNLFDGVRRNGAEAAFSALADSIGTMLAGTHLAGSGPAKWINDWSSSLVRRAALTGLGRSTRQIARRVRSWTGVSERDLHGLGHTETLYARFLEAIADGDLDWAGLAAASGFADQAHMIRQMRRHTGFTPEQFRHAAAHDEAFWAYRLLGEYFTKPNGP